MSDKVFYNTSGITLSFFCAEGTIRAGSRSSLASAAGPRRGPARRGNMGPLKRAATCGPAAGRAQAKANNWASPISYARRPVADAGARGAGERRRPKWLRRAHLGIWALGCAVAKDQEGRLQARASKEGRRGCARTAGRELCRLCHEAHPPGAGFVLACDKYGARRRAWRVQILRYAASFG
jgi:hypothetical protein